MTWASPQSGGGIPAEVVKLALLVECKAGGSIPVAWGIKAEGLKTVGSLTFVTTLNGVSLTQCKANAAGLDSAGAVIWWAGRVGGLGESVATGTLSASFGSASATSVGLASNGQGGFDWVWQPGLDNDGDGIFNVSDPCPAVAGTCP